MSWDRIQFLSTLNYGMPPEEKLISLEEKMWGTSVVTVLIFHEVSQWISLTMTLLVNSRKLDVWSVKIISTATFKRTQTHVLLILILKILKTGGNFSKVNRTRRNSSLKEVLRPSSPLWDMCHLLNPIKSLSFKSDNTFHNSSKMKDPKESKLPSGTPILEKNWDFSLVLLKSTNSKQEQEPLM